MYRFSSAKELQRFLTTVTVVKYARKNLETNGVSARFP